MEVTNVPSLPTICRKFSSDEHANNLEIRDGEDVHVGFYKNGEESMHDAIWRTIRHFANKLKPITPDMIGVDLGCEIGGMARYFASVYECHIVAVNMSKTENSRHQAINNVLGMPLDQIEILEATFTNIPKPNDTFDFALSQDRMMHADDCQKIFHEVYRVLKPGSKFVVTDLMQVDDVSVAALRPINDHIKLTSLSSPERCHKMAQEAGFQVLEYEDFTEHLANHYRHLLVETERRIEELPKDSETTHFDQTKKELQLLIDGGNNGQLEWGIFVLQKPG